VLKSKSGSPLDAACVLASLFELAELEPHLGVTRDRVLVGLAGAAGTAPTWVEPVLAAQGAWDKAAAEGARLAQEAAPVVVDLARMRELGVYGIPR
jgi:hypothetical protein